MDPIGEPEGSRPTEGRATVLLKSQEKQSIGIILSVVSCTDSLFRQ